jgi:hypothetical protein
MQPSGTATDQGDSSCWLSSAVPLGVDLDFGQSSASALHCHRGRQAASAAEVPQGLKPAFSKRLNCRTEGLLLLICKVCSTNFDLAALTAHRATAHSFTYISVKTSLTFRNSPWAENGLGR